MLRAIAYVLPVLPMHNTRKALLASLLIAATVALGYALAGIPNVELMTITVFVAGFLLGARLGIGVGIGAMLLHSTFNPLGMAHPFLLGAQVAGFALVGLGGGVLGPWIMTIRSRWLALLVSGVTGFVLTLVYQLLVNTGSFYAFSGSGDYLLTYIKLGLVFTALHLAWNTGLFATALLPTLRVLERYRREII